MSNENTPTEMERVVVRVLPDGRMSRRHAAAYLGYTEKTLAMWKLQSKGPPAHRVGGRCFYYKNELDAFIRGETTESVAAHRRIMG